MKKRQEPGGITGYQTGFWRFPFIVTIFIS